MVVCEMRFWVRELFAKLYCLLGNCTVLNACLKSEESK